MKSLLLRKLSACMVACSALVAGCSVHFNQAGVSQVIGSGRSTTENRIVSGISVVSLQTSGKLIVQYGETESLSVTADDNVLPVLTSDVVNGRLILGSKPNSSLFTRSEIVYRLMVKDMQAIEILGSGDAVVSAIKSENLNVTLNGSGNLNTDGSVKRQSVTINGSGTYNGANLNSQQAKVVCSGSGDATVKVSEDLKVTINGSGDVSYIGSPSISEKIILGSGTLHQR